VIPYDLPLHFRLAQLAGENDFLAVIFPVLPKLSLRQELRANALVLGALALFGVILHDIVLEHHSTVCTPELSVLKLSQLLEMRFVGFEFVTVATWTFFVLKPIDTWLAPPSAAVISSPLNRIVDHLRTQRAFKQLRVERLNNSLCGIKT
jgi:hypothetical protein